MYDPTIGRFLSADPIIQTLALSQAINPFSYVMNMPLTLTDPSGMSWLSKLFHNIGKAIFGIVGIAVGLFASPLLLVGYGLAGAGALVLTGASAFVGAAMANGLLAQLHLPGWANDAIVLAAAIITGGMSLAEIGKTIAHHVEEYIVRREMERVLRKNGLTLAEVDAVLEVLSIIGEQLPNTRDSHGRLIDNRSGTVDIFGVGNRHWYGAPFDVADVLLGYQGLPTGASWRYITGGRIGQDIVAHSLGTLDASNLDALGLAGKVTLYSVPLGITAPSLRGGTVTLSAGDAVNGFFLGWLFNPEAINSHGQFLAHPMCGHSNYFDPVMCR